MKTITAIIFLVSFSTLNASPSRCRLLFHSGMKVSENLKIKGSFLPAGNLMVGVSPLSYLGLNFKIREFDIQPTLGWASEVDELILSVQTSYSHAKFWSWLDIEIQPQSWSIYWFTQAEYQITSWFATGLEADGWGMMSDSNTLSYGGGPNLLLRYGKLGMDIAVHFRHAHDQQLSPELFLRWHIFL